MKSSLLILLAAATLSVAACNRSNTLPEDANAGADGAGADSGFSTNTQGGGGDISVSPLEAERQRLMQELVVYFDYDTADILPEFNALLAAHGQFLAQNPNTQLRLEGHADERGSREYNIGLGQRRSDGLKKMMILLGARENQIESVSLGEEKPHDEGHSEQSWSKNRRSDILYGGEF
jgi:peptidoglycan-associated lipoprotein